jgi:hypothetical protein
LPEGLRTKELIEIYSLVQVFPASSPNATDADQIAFGGFMYEVEVTDDKSGAGNYFHAIARKIGK